MTRHREALETTAAALVSDGKGILAADESPAPGTPSAA
jgi:fructose-bisphosphate aldolase class 1